MTSTHNSPFGGSGGTFNNAGTLNWNGTYATWGYSDIDPVFNNTGTVNVNNNLRITGTLSQSGTIDVASGATFTKTGGFTNTGTLRGVGTVDIGGTSYTLTNTGTICPGGSATAGTLSITGNFTNGSTGIIEAELGGATADTYDVLAVSGTATLGGTLTGTLINGFTPSGQSFDVITAGTASGSFATSNLPNGVNGAIVVGTPYTYRLTQSGATCSGICWDGGAGTTNWTDAANWTADTLPGSLDVAYLNLVAGVTVDLSNSSQTIRALNSDFNNHLTIGTGGALTLSDAATTSILHGNLTINGGTLTANGTANLEMLNLISGTASLNGGTYVWNLNMSGGSLNANAGLGVATFAMSGGTWSQIATTLPDLIIYDFQLSGGTFIRALGGDGSTATPYQLADIYGVQGMASAGMLGNSYVLANNIDASGTVNWNAGAGFAPIGDVTTVFTGSFNGQNNTISNLTINRPGTAKAGLFGASGGMVGNVGLLGGSVSGGTDSVGGLVGWNTSTGSISNSYNTGVVLGALDSTGGLVGVNDGAISGSHATGNVMGGQWFAAGFAGMNTTTGSISGSYSTGNVMGKGSSGGFVGWNGGSIDSSYATGNMSNPGGGPGCCGWMGGLVGDNYGSISNSYATGNTTAEDRVGGLVGHLNGGSVTNSYSTGIAFANWGSHGGLIGGWSAGTVTNSYWDMDTSGLGSSAGGAGLTTAQMKTMPSFTGWNIANTGGSGATWRIYEGHTYPLLKSFLTPTTVTVHDATKHYDGVTYSGGNGVSYAGTLLGTPAYGGASQGAVNAGSYAITESGLYSNQQGYDVSYMGSTLTIAPASLTVTANAASKTYDGLAYSGGNGVTYVGFVGMENEAVLGGTLTYGGTSQGAINTGSYLITPGGYTSSNYAISYVDGTLTISPAVLTLITASLTGTASKTYDGTANATLTPGNFLLSGFVNTDSATVTQTTGTYASQNAGSGILVSATLTETDFSPVGSTQLSNYTLPTGASGNIGSITPAPLTVTANSDSKIYDNLAYSGGNGVTYSGFVNNETSAVLGGALAYSGTSQGAVNVGNYFITPGGLNSGNYTISYLDGTLTINQPITTAVVQTVTTITTTATNATTTTAAATTTTAATTGTAANAPSTAPITVDTAVLAGAVTTTSGPMVTMVGPAGGTIGGTAGSFGGDTVVIATEPLPATTTPADTPAAQPVESSGPGGEGAAKPESEGKKEDTAKKDDDKKGKGDKDKSKSNDDKDKGKDKSNEKPEKC